MFYTFVFYDVFSPAKFSTPHSTQYLALIIQYVLAFLSLIMMFNYVLHCFTTVTDSEGVCISLSIITFCNCCLL